MKKYFYRLFVLLLSSVALISCADEEGTMPGNDSNPAIGIYQYKPAKPYNADNDVTLRFAVNNKTAEAYYLAEKSTDKAARIASLGEEGYMDYVVSKGTKIDKISETSFADVTLTDMYGEYTVTAVAVGQGKKSSFKTIFTGLDWADVVSGTYRFFNAAKLGIAASRHTVLQVCTTNPKLFRFKDVFAAGYHMKINIIDYTGTDADGQYKFFRVPATDTPYTYGTAGTVGVRDIGYWQGNDSFVTTGGYESGMYTDYNCFIYVQYYVVAGNLGYGYDSFEVD